MSKGKLIGQSHEKRRRFPRYQCDGDARLRANGGWKELDGVEQISQGGCYIATSDPLPVGTELELQVQIGNQPFQTRGIVLYSHPSKGMGVGFVQTAQEREQFLKNILQELAKKSPQV